MEHAPGCHLLECRTLAERMISHECPGCTCGADFHERETVPPDAPADGEVVRVAVTSDHRVRVTITGERDFFFDVDAEMAEWLGKSLIEGAQTLRGITGRGGSA